MSYLDSVVAWLSDCVLDVVWCGHQDFLKPWYTKCHISSTVTSQMEGVQCHLGGWLSNTLGCDCSDILSRLHKRLHVFHVVHISESVGLNRLIFSLEQKIPLTWILHVLKLFLFNLQFFNSTLTMFLLQMEFYIFWRILGCLGSQANSSENMQFY